MNVKTAENLIKNALRRSAGSPDKTVNQLIAAEFAAYRPKPPKPWQPFPQGSRQTPKEHK